jgi:hypothetical protein
MHAIAFVSVAAKRCYSSSMPKADWRRRSPTRWKAGSLPWPAASAGVSRSAVLARLVGMGSNGARGRRWLAAVVLAHLVISIAHGAVHGEAQVPLSRPANLFVLIVILAGPLVGLALTWPAERVGSWLVAVTMAGAFVFGLVNHFVVASPDHVTRVALPWRPLFTATAVLLALTEALGSGLAIRLARATEEVR